jgi:hypothetical protein
VAVLLLVAPASYAKVRTDAVIPYYARLSDQDLFHTDDWAVIVFYKLPECVPDDFNLLEFLDVPNALYCADTTAGFMIWAGEPWESAPIQMEVQGMGEVPVWFVSWPKLEAAIADDVLFVSDLERMSPLIGSASFYNETLHPSEGAKVSMINYVAHGTLLDGRTFQVNVTWPHAVGPEAPIRNVRIEFE